MSSEYDPEEFGKVLARLDAQDKTLARMEDNVASLLTMANQGKGGLMMLTTIGGLVGAIMGFLGGWLIR